MKKLWIMRHASPANYGPDGSDFSRPLTGVGELEAQQQGALFKEQGVPIDRVLSSSASRAETTAHHFISGYTGNPELLVDYNLYNASGEQLYSAIKEQPDQIHHLMVIAHMPGVAELVYFLSTSHYKIDQPFMPATVVLLSFSTASWRDLIPSSGEFQQHISPPVINT